VAAAIRRVVFQVSLYGKVDNLNESLIAKLLQKLQAAIATNYARGMTM
jgi:hypothetical protein